MSGLRCGANVVRHFLNFSLSPTDSPQRHLKVRNDTLESGLVGFVILQVGKLRSVPIRAFFD
jgi:hypothetical protein